MIFITISTKNIQLTTRLLKLYRYSIFTTTYKGEERGGNADIEIASNMIRFIKKSECRGGGKRPELPSLTCFCFLKSWP